MDKHEDKEKEEKTPEELPRAKSHTDSELTEEDLKKVAAGARHIDWVTKC